MKFKSSMLSYWIHEKGKNLRPIINGKDCFVYLPRWCKGVKVNDSDYAEDKLISCISNSLFYIITINIRILESKCNILKPVDTKFNILKPVEFKFNILKLIDSKFNILKPFMFHVLSMWLIFNKRGFYYYVLFQMFRYYFVLFDLT